MRRPIGKTIQDLCKSCEQPSTIGEIAFLMGIDSKMAFAHNQMCRAIKLGLVYRSGERLKTIYTAFPDWRERIKAHNEKPQAHHLPGYVKPVRYVPRVPNSVFQLGAMQ